LRPLSTEIADWYDPIESAWFTKQVIDLHGKVFIEATELGDVLATGKFPYVQGVEIPQEDSTSVNSRCGQAATTTFYMELRRNDAQSRPVPKGGLECTGLACKWPDVNTFDWTFAWNWRRARCGNLVNSTLCPQGTSEKPPTPGETRFINIGDITQQNSGNVIDNAYLFLEPSQATMQHSTAGWQGGINLTVLAMLEQRSYGWYHFMIEASRHLNNSMRKHISLSEKTAGTRHGLSKFPYLRDTRRSAAGLDGFRLMFNGTMNFRNSSAPSLGYQFHDAVGLVNAFVHSYPLVVESCSYPSYIHDGENQTKLSWIPLRALTVNNVENLLVAGKTMSQTAHANDATRKHTGEWTSGVAAGGTAVIMVRQGWSSRDAYRNIGAIRAFLNSSAVGQPLEWHTDGFIDRRSRTTII